MAPEEASRRKRRRRGSAELASLALFGAAAIGVLQFYDPPTDLFASRLGDRLAADSALVSIIAPARTAFGRSGEVRMRFALPEAAVEVPLEVQGTPAELAYQWVPLHAVDTGAPFVADEARPLTGHELVAPAEPGFYRLALVREGGQQVIDGLTLAVLVPFSKKLGSTLNGYRIGTYLAERLRGHAETPPGFVEVRESDLDLPITSHLRIADFITRDNQKTWPRYAALDPRLLDKLELVLAKLESWRQSDSAGVSVDVHSGFRTPLYNRRVQRSAKDSRHQYGDAVDVAIDANGDGRITVADSRLIAQAVDSVEAEHPDLVGGLGLYSKHSTPYVHIDARGRRARWRG